MKTKHKNKDKRAAIRGQIIMILIVIIFAYPFAYMVSTSFKTMSEIFRSGLNLIPDNPTVDNYIKVFTSLPIGSYLYNSTVIALIAMTAKIITSTHIDCIALSHFLQ